MGLTGQSGKGTSDPIARTVKGQFSRVGVLGATDEVLGAGAQIVRRAGRGGC